MSVRNFEKFEIDKWYIYTGTEPKADWNSLMNSFALDHKPVKCNMKHSKYHIQASFEGMGSKRLWNWKSGFDNWIEIKDPIEEHKIFPQTKVYNQKTNCIFWSGVERILLPAKDKIFVLRDDSLSSNTAIIIELSVYDEDFYISEKKFIRL